MNTKQIAKIVVDVLNEQADRIAELEKQGKPVAWMSPDGKVSTTEGILFHIPLYTTPQTNNKNRSWSDICDEATAVWDSLDTSNQSNIECARAWFLEGYHQALTRGQE